MMTTADGLYHALTNDKPISPGEAVDFGLDENPDLVSLYTACINKGATAEDFREASCNGPKLTMMVRRFFPDASPIHTCWDDFGMWDDEEEDTP